MWESKFSIESLRGVEFDGSTGGEEWNGFACPYFTFEQGMRIVEAHNDSGELGVYYDEDKDSFVFDFPAGSEEFEAEIIEERKLYGIGCGTWIWEER